MNFSGPKDETFEDYFSGGTGGATDGNSKIERIIELRKSSLKVIEKTINPEEYLSNHQLLFQSNMIYSRIDAVAIQPSEVGVSLLKPMAVLHSSVEGKQHGELYSTIMPTPFNLPSFNITSKIYGFITNSSKVNNIHTLNSSISNLVKQNKQKTNESSLINFHFKTYLSERLNSTIISSINASKPLKMGDMELFTPKVSKIILIPTKLVSYEQKEIISANELNSTNHEKTQKGKLKNLLNYYYYPNNVIKQ